MRQLVRPRAPEWSGLTLDVSGGCVSVVPRLARKVTVKEADKESSPFRVLRCQPLGNIVLREFRMPSFKILTPLPVENACSDLQEHVCAALRPSHLLFLYHAFRHDLVDCRFRETGRDRLIVPAPLGVVGNRRNISRDVVRELLECFVERLGGLGLRVAIRNGRVTAQSLILVAGQAIQPAYGFQNLGILAIVRVAVHSGCTRPLSCRNRMPRARPRHWKTGTR